MNPLVLAYYASFCVGDLAMIFEASTGSGSDLYNESETITKFEIMDGEFIAVAHFMAADL